jgi:hypothetical protein
MNTANSKMTSRGAASLKASIAAGAFVATLGGWSLLAIRDRAPVAPAGSQPTPVLAGAAPLEPLPGLRVVSEPLAGSGVPDPVAVTQSSR